MAAHELSHAADVELVTASADRAEVAFREIYRRYHRALFTFVLRRAGGSREMAEDIVQEAFVRFWRGRHQFDEGRGSVAALLFTMARNLAVDEQRRRGRAVSEKVLVASASPAVTVDADVTSAVLVSAALARLAPAQRDLLTLAYWEDLSQGQLAEVLRVPVGTVKSRLFHATRALRRELQPVGAA